MIFLKRVIFGLSHRDKRVEKTNLLHFSVSDLELQEPSIG